MLIEQTQKYLVETEKEATELIEDFKAKQAVEGYNLSKAAYVRKETNNAKMNTSE